MQDMAGARHPEADSRVLDLGDVRFERDVDRAFEMLWSVLLRLEPDDSRRIGTAVRMLYDAFGAHASALRRAEALEAN